MREIKSKVATLKEKDFSLWDDFVDRSPQGCIFCRSWWLKAVCPEGFEILALQKKGRIIAGIPLPISRRWGNTDISMPSLTQSLGILLEPPTSEKYETRLSKETETISSLIEAMPQYGHFSMNFHYNFTNWLPFYWTGFRQTTRYTYLIEDLANQQELKDNLSQQVRNKIRKAEALGISIVTSDDIGTIIELNKMTFARQGFRLPYSEDLVRRIDKECVHRDARRIFLAKDRQHRIHSAIFVVFDGKSMYNLIQGGDPGLRHSGANPLAMWHSIKFAGEVTRKYDFEGSMLPNIEPFFRSFGAVQTPYFNISKDSRSLVTKARATLYRLARGAMKKAVYR
jgi:hypothetical protein